MQQPDSQAPGDKRDKRMFIGEYSHSIDAKGRITVPSKFREALGERFTVTKGLDGCLWAFPEAEWEEFSSKLAELPTSRRDARVFSRFFFAGAAEAEPDKMGRILLPQVLREYADLTDEAVVTGNGSKVEIWSKDRWKDNSTFEDVDELAEHMGEWGFGI